MAVQPVHPASQRWHQGKKLKFQNTAGVLQRSEAFFHCQDLLVAGGFLHANHHLADAGCREDLGMLCERGSNKKHDYGERLWGSFGQNLIIVWSALSAHFHHFLGSVVLSLIRRRNCSQEFIHGEDSKWKHSETWRNRKTFQMQKTRHYMSQSFGCPAHHQRCGLMPLVFKQEQVATKWKAKKSVWASLPKHISTSPKGIAGWFWFILVSVRLRCWPKTATVLHCSPKLCPGHPSAHLLPFFHHSCTVSSKGSSSCGWRVMTWSSASMATFPTNMGASPSTHGF